MRSLSRLSIELLGLVIFEGGEGFLEVVNGFFMVGLILEVFLLVGVC